uniref:Claudin n=1 Tax=Gouania willdenowi TaxID=441366 RepID=A0A8C5HQZ9_GOUWI
MFRLKTMASTGLQVMGLVLALLGWVCGGLVCAAPLWRVSAFVGGELVIAQVLWEGLWMNCLSQTTGHIQCKTYDSTLALPSSLQAARVTGAKCTHCMGDAKQALKARLASLGGVLFIVAGLAYLVPICWTAYAIISDFYDPNVAAPLKRELGPALYLGWGASIMLLVGGTLICVWAVCVQKASVHGPVWAVGAMLVYLLYNTTHHALHALFCEVQFITGIQKMHRILIVFLYK